MCSAEEDLRYAEKDIAWLEGVVDEIIELAADVERGIIDLGEFRNEAERRRIRSRSFA